VNIEYANNSTRKGVTPPTKAEFAEAASRGLILSGDLLREMRAEGRAQRKESVIPVAARPGPSDTLTVTKLKNKIERLKNQIAILKVRLMSSK
jgi:hypothetical protein